MDAGAAAPHRLFVSVAPQAAAPSLEVLRYIAENLGVIRQMGVLVRVAAIEAGDPALVELHKAGIGALPALVTPNSQYTGVGEILALYRKNVANFRKHSAAASPAGDSGDGDELARFYRKEMAEDLSDGEDAIGDGQKLKDAYRAMTAQRDKKGAARPPSENSGPPPPDRPQNPLPPPQAPLLSGGGADPDDEGDNGPQDLLMEKAYWDNQESSF